MYDAVKILAYGLEHGGENAIAIRDAIASMKGLPSSLGGTLAMGPDHYTIVPSIAVYQVRKGVELQVYPA